MMTHLGQLVPELIEVTEDLGVDTGTADAVNVAQDPQDAPPEDEGGVGVPSRQTATGDDADVIRQKLAAVCNEEHIHETQNMLMMEIHQICESSMRFYITPRVY